MELPLRSEPQHPSAQREDGRSSEAQIRQEGSRFGATHVTGGSVFQGNFVGLTLNSTAATRPDFAGHFAHAALEPVKAFVPRSSLHDQIHAQLARDAAGSGTRTLVVWGLGGAGKTQLVLDYVQQHRTEYKATFWIEAGRKESLERDFVRLYQTLFGLHTSARAETAISVEDAVTGVKSWFAGQQARWLMVFDGADTIEDEVADGYIDIKHFIPSAASLDVIIASRSTTAKDMTRLEGVHVGEMEAGQAAELFWKYARIPRDDKTVRDEVVCIVKELGCLALAVTLAATYVGSTPRLQSDVKAYLPEYRQRRRELLRRKPESLVHQYSESVLMTWETSYAAVAGQCAEAAMLMTLLSFLSFNDIYLGLFCTDSVQDSVEQADESSACWRRLVSLEQPVDMYKIEECFAVLQKYSLVQWKAEQRGYAVHKLVHAWGYDRLTAEEQSTYGRAAFGLVKEALEAVSNQDRPLEDKLRLIPHAVASFTKHVGAIVRSNGDTKELAREMASVGKFIIQLGRWREARVAKEYVLQAWSRLLGKEHPDTITAMNNLANTPGEEGSLEEATPMMTKVLQKGRLDFDEGHADSISAMINVANKLRQQGHLDDAAMMLREVLKKPSELYARHVLREAHSDTLKGKNDLAITIGKQGHPEEAAEMQEEVLEKRQRMLGEEHPDTIRAKGNLAIISRLRSLQDQEQLHSTTSSRTDAAPVQIPLDVPNSLPRASGRRRAKLSALLKGKPRK